MLVKLTIENTPEERAFIKKLATFEFSTSTHLVADDILAKLSHRAVCHRKGEVCTLIQVMK